MEISEEKGNAAPTTALSPALALTVATSPPTAAGTGTGAGISTSASSTTTTTTTMPVAPKVKVKVKERVEDVKWVGIEKSMLTVFKRPSELDLQQLHKQGLTLVVTLQASKAEKADTIGVLCGALGVRWLHVPIPGRKQLRVAPNDIKDAMAKGIYTVYKSLVQNKEACLVHCQLGLHRSALFVYSLLRVSGLDREGALTTLKIVREKAHAEIKEHRIAYPEKELIPRVLALLSKTPQTVSP